jgi:hypothetical protein
MPTWADHPRGRWRWRAGTSTRPTGAWSTRTWCARTSPSPRWPSSPAATRPTRGRRRESAEDAVSVLYLSASAQKRSYIRAFAQLLEAAGDALKFPQALPRVSGAGAAPGAGGDGRGGGGDPAPGPRHGSGPRAGAGAGDPADVPARRRDARTRCWTRSTKRRAPRPAPRRLRAGACRPELLERAATPPRVAVVRRQAARARSGRARRSGGQGGSAAGAGAAARGLDVRLSMAGIAGMDGRSDALRCTLRDGRVQLSGPAVAPDVDEDRLRRAVPGLLQVAAGVARGRPFPAGNSQAMFIFLSLGQARP